MNILRGEADSINIIPFFILCCSIIINFWYFSSSDKLIIYLNIENKFINYFKKYPKIVKYIELRRKLTDYYIKLNFILILIIVLFTLYVNICILFTY